ncbi:unnamed protein product [Leptidea sinapis]|uniref:Uncharacterized protein n=1 Tax=Leptidea sinapis TaxID=189913 RepID=A0A5E4QZ94_9NEOP|nr:unnamed protein product [Leptidea sinapis]
MKTRTPPIFNKLSIEYLMIRMLKMPSSLEETVSLMEKQLKYLLDRTVRSRPAVLKSSYHQQSLLTQMERYGRVTTGRCSQRMSLNGFERPRRRYIEETRVTRSVFRSMNLAKTLIMIYNIAI